MQGKEGQMAEEHILILDISRLKEPSVFEACLEKVSPQRREQAKRHAALSGKCQSLGAGLVLNEILERFGLDPKAAVLKYGDYNKPYLPDRPGLHFNLTHSGKFAGGVWGGFPVGIDIEQVDKLREGVAGRFFHRGERMWLEGLSCGAERTKGFFRLWVLKESFIKATGLGMRLPLNEFQILIEENEVRVNHQVNHKVYYFQEFELEGCVGAVCGENRQVMSWGIKKISAG